MSPATPDARPKPHHPLFRRMSIPASCVIRRLRDLCSLRASHRCSLQWRHRVRRRHTLHILLPPPLLLSSFVPESVLKKRAANDQLRMKAATLRAAEKVASKKKR